MIGGGLAGLSTAVALAAKGVEVSLIEGAAQPGGRCRSYLDPVLGMTIDNGNHLVLSGNSATFRYLRAIGSANRMVGPSKARIDFFDLDSGRGWTLRPNDGPLAWWVLSGRRRVPGARLGDYLKLIDLLRAPPGARIDQVIECRGVLWDRLLQPFLLAALNTHPPEASAALAAAVIRETLARGGRAYRPRIAEPSLAAAFIDPAAAFLQDRGAQVRLGRRVRAMTFDHGRVSQLILPDETIEVGKGDAVVLAAPPWVSQELVAGLRAPDQFTAIVNAHFKVATPGRRAPMVGLIGGAAEWVFTFPDRISITVSAADSLVDRDRDDLAQLFWRDVCAVSGRQGPPPPWQIVKERRATFAATAEQNAKRPKAQTQWANLILAGDWTDTGLPATIEGAMRSGATAAKLARGLVR